MNHFLDLIKQGLNQKFFYGKSSESKIKLAHPDLQKILYLVIQVTEVDLGVSETNRSLKKQNLYFRQGKSKIDGITKIGKHNYNPSLAVDFYGYVNGKTCYDPEVITYLYGVFRACTEILYAMGEITHKIRWGGNWDMDGEILTDQTFDDRPHIELYKPKS